MCAKESRVSIHALTRRATKVVDVVSAINVVSIHALTRRATEELRKVAADKIRFNPRPHAEGDNNSAFFVVGLMVSIHALTRRATRLQVCSAMFRRFQSTPSRGGRPEGDGYEKPCVLVSIHALTRRATAFEIAQGITAEVSIHALTRRATLCKAIEISNSSFNPRPHAEGDD